MFEFIYPCYNFDRNVASVIVILKDELSLWNVGKPWMTLQSIPHVSLSMDKKLSLRLGWFTWCHSLKKSITMEWKPH